MDEAVSFWLENRNCAGTRMAAIGEQLLVRYRDRYYIVANGAAQTRGSKPLRFATSSLPANWKLALRGEAPPTVTEQSGIDELTTTRPPKRERKKAEKPAMPERKQETTQEISDDAQLPAVKARRKTEAKPAAQPPVLANCPYCNTRHEIAVEKGKSGKPFFMPCSKCNSEFAVRFVQVSIYKAQVAAFQ